MTNSIGVTACISWGEISLILHTHKLRECIKIGKHVVYVLLGISPASDCGLPTFRNPLSVPSSKAGCGAFEDGTDRPQSDAGEIPKRTYTTFKTQRKFEIKNR